MEGFCGLSMQQPPAFLQHLEHFNPQMLNMTQEQVILPLLRTFLVVFFLFVNSICILYVLVVLSPSKWAAPSLWFTTNPKLPSYDATDGPCSTWAAPAWFYWATRLSRGISSSQCFPAATGKSVTTCELLS